MSEEIKCAYCSKPIETDDVKVGTIISRNWASTNYTSPPRKYHKAKGCHSYDQMAHEG